MGCIGGNAIKVEEEHRPERQTFRRDTGKPEKKVTIKLSPFLAKSKPLDVIQESPRGEYKFDYQEFRKSSKSIKLVTPDKHDLGDDEEKRFSIAFFRKAIDRLKTENMLDVLEDINHRYFDIYFLNFVITEQVNIFPYILDEPNRNLLVFSLFMMFYLESTEETDEVKQEIIEKFLYTSLENTPTSSKELALRKVLQDLSDLFFAIYLAESFSDETEEILSSSEGKCLNKMLENLISSLKEKGVEVDLKKLIKKLQLDEAKIEEVDKIAEKLASRAEPDFYTFL